MYRLLQYCTAVLREAWATLLEGNSGPLPATVATTWNLAHPSLETAVLFFPVPKVPIPSTCCYSKSDFGRLSSPPSDSVYDGPCPVFFLSLGLISNVHFPVPRSHMITQFTDPAIGHWQRCLTSSNGSTVLSIPLCARLCWFLLLIVMTSLCSINFLYTTHTTGWANVIDADLM